MAFTALATQVILVTCMMRFHTGDFDFSVFQMQMFILAATGQLLGAAISERAEATRVLRRQQSDLARVTSQATTGALAVAFAHEISQPLSSLSGYLHGAKRMLTAGPGRSKPSPASWKRPRPRRAARARSSRAFANSSPAARWIFKTWTLPPLREKSWR